MLTGEMLSKEFDVMVYPVKNKNNEIKIIEFDSLTELFTAKYKWVNNDKVITKLVKSNGNFNKDQIKLIKEIEKRFKEN